MNPERLWKHLQGRVESVLGKLLESCGAERGFRLLLLYNLASRVCFRSFILEGPFCVRRL